VIADLVLESLGNRFIDDEIKCEDKYSISPTNEIGAVFLLS
jgi:hypothetical protein